MSRYNKPSSYKRINYLKFLYFGTIIVALSSFYIFTSIITSLSDAHNASNSTEIDTLFETADVLLNQKKYEEAIEYFDKILTINASEIDALNHKGLALWELQKYNEALQHFDRILSMNASDVYAINNKAKALAEIGKNEEALSVIEKTAKDNPNDEYLQSTMAFILGNMGKYDEARVYYEKALKINSNLTKILYDKELDVFNKIRGNTTTLPQQQQ